MSDQPDLVQHHGQHPVCTGLVRGFALDAQTALDLLVELWNPRCEPPWHVGPGGAARDSLERKIRQAIEVGHMAVGAKLIEPGRASLPPGTSSISNHHQESRMTLTMSQPAPAITQPTSAIADTAADLPVILAEGPFLDTMTGAADRFAATFRQRLLHADGEGWLVWDGIRWEPSGKRAHHLAHRFAKAVLLEARHAARELAQREADIGQRRLATQHVLGPERAPIDAQVQEMKSEAERLAAKVKPRMKLADTLNAGNGPATLLKAAESQPAFFVQARDLDPDPMLLSLQNGVLDLRTRTLMPPDPDRRITKLAPVAWNPSATCPTWHAFIDTITLGRRDLARYLQRALGYSLTGSTREQVFFLCVGGGANGKSTLLEVVKALMGEYAASVDHTTILVKRHPKLTPLRH